MWTRNEPQPSVFDERVVPRIARAVADVCD